MTKAELNDLLELVEAVIDNKDRASDITESVRLMRLKEDFIANWCSEVSL